MPGLECVSDNDLRAFLLGELPERLSATVARHLEQCPDCETAARRLDALTDPVIDALRGAAGPEEHDAPTRPIDTLSGHAGSESDPAPFPAVPGYTVLRELARTGASVVYEAQQEHPGRPVALKMLLAGAHAGLDRRSRLLAEADAIARLRHPNIVQVYDVGHLSQGPQGGFPYLALEFMEGGSLATFLGGTPLSPGRAAALLEKLARAVQHAHERGVIHRDLKPANVLLTKDGTPKVADFGLARHQRPELTATGAILGTPSYMAPEQAAGDNQAVGPRADVYALGAILYECLTGRPPFRGESNLETIRQVAVEEPVPPSRLRAAIPRDLETVCLKCLEKDQARRYATAEALADDLSRFTRGEPVRARPLGHLGRGWRWCRRKPAVALLLAALLLALLTGTAVSSSFAWWALAEADRARGHAKAADDNAARARREKEHGERQLYLARLSLLRIAWNENNLARARELLAATRPRDGDQDCRNFEWYYYNRALNADLRTFKAPWGIEVLAVSPDGRRVAAGYWDKVVVWDVKSGETLFTFVMESPAVAYALAFSPDGTRLACGIGISQVMAWQGTEARRTGKLGPSLRGRVTVWELAAGKVISEWIERRGCVLAVAFSPDGTRVAGTFCSNLDFSSDLRFARLWGGGQVAVWDAATGKERLILDWSGCDGVWFSPDGIYLRATNRFSSKAWDFANDREIEPGKSDERVLGTSRDGRWLALLRDPGAIVTLRDTTPGNGPGSVVPSGASCGVVFAADGGRVAFLGSGSVEVWNLVPADGRYTMRAHTGGVTTAAFSDDGSVLVTGGADGFVRVWPANLGSDPPLLRRPADTLAFTADGQLIADGAHLDVGSGRVLREYGKGRSALSADGRFLAVAGADGVTRVWDIFSSQEKPHLELRGTTGEVLNLSFSAGGERLGCVSSRNFKVWNLHTGEALPWPPSLLPATSRAFLSPDCRRAAYYRFQTVKVYNLETGEEVCSLEGPNEGQSITTIAFSPDGHYLASGTKFRSIRIYDLERKCEVFTLAAPACDNRFQLAFSADGRRLAACCWGQWSDGSNVRVWELETGQETASFRAAHLDKPVALAFNPDGRRLATATVRGIKVWGEAP